MAKEKKDATKKEKKKNPSLLDATQRENAGAGTATAIGTYKESYGGGTPLAKGEKAPSEEWLKENRVQQPRDADGQFTYNSANNKELKYGPSRGKTIPPFLLGSKCLYAIKKKSSVAFGGKVYWAGVDMSLEEFIAECQEYRPESKIRQPMKGKPGGGSKAEKDFIKQGGKGFIGADYKNSFKFQDKSDFLKTKYNFVNFMQQNKPKTGSNAKNNNYANKKTNNTTTQDNLNKNNVTKNINNVDNINKNNSSNAKMAKDNPKEFVKKNSMLIKSIMKMNPKLSPGKLVKLIASGKYESLEKIKEILQKNKK